MPVVDDEASIRSVEFDVGNPQTKWDALKERVQVDAIREFSIIQADWLDLLFTLDTYRSRSVVPRGMGNPSLSPSKRLEGIYRSKGNWYADLISLLLGNRTSQILAPRTRVEGFSQRHQIDVAWPDREVDPLVCLETKVTGAPANEGNKQRSAMADWTNRRKELKFAATDLKLSRRQSATTIDHWDVWRAREMPKCYFLWGARLTSRDNIEKMVREVQALTMTYLDGAGLVAWKEEGGIYVPVSVMGRSPSDRVSSVDDVLHRVANEITELAPSGEPPPPELPSSRVVDVSILSGDAEAR